MKAKRILLSTMVATALLALAGVVAAHGPGHGAGYGQGMRGGMGGYGPGMASPETAAVRMAALKERLKLQPSQAAAFDAYANKIKSEAEARAKFREGMQSRIGDAQAMSDYHVTIAKHRADAAADLNQLRRDLAAVLTPEQKQVFDTYGPGGFGMRAGGGPGRGAGWGPGCAAKPA